MPTDSTSQSGVPEHHSIVRQRQYAVAHPRDDLPVRPRYLGQVLRESAPAGRGVSSIVGGRCGRLLLVLSGRDPDEAIVAEDDAGAAGQLVEVGLSPLDQAGGHLDESALGKFPVLERSAIKMAEHQKN